MARISTARDFNVLAVVVALGLSFGVVSQASARQNDDERAKQERASDLIELLGARDGAHIADIGAAGGFYTLRIAKAVAPTGRAYGVDIDEKMVELMRQRVAKEGIANLEPILGTADDPKLPEGRLDAVLIRNAYHEMPQYAQILEAVKRSLKPGGLLVVSEALHDNNRPLTREQQVKEHEMAPEIVEAELKEAGFEVLSREELFTKFTRPPPGGYWVIRARKP